MSIAITEDHATLAETAADLLEARDARGAARELLEATEEARPELWTELSSLGWLGLHVPEEHGGSGYGLEELVVVVEQLGAAMCPGPFVPTVVASAALVSMGATDRLAGLADGSVAAGIALEGDLDLDSGRLRGSAVVLGGGLADLLVVAVNDDVALVEADAAGVVVEVPSNIDPTRRAARVTFDGAEAEVLSGAAHTLLDHARLVFSAEAVGIARSCTDTAAAYAKEREQFGRPIGTFQAVKHHCADMHVATELATCLVWDAARADSDEFPLAAAMAATVALPAADRCANLNIQVHGGVGFTWEHDAHLYLRRATALRSLLDVEAAAGEVVDRTRAGERVTTGVELPPEAEPIRAEVQAFVERVEGLDEEARREVMIETGYVAPHWPTPWGRAAGPIEQLVIEEEFKAAGVKKPSYSITGWVILTLIQFGTEDQVQRWVPRTLRQDWVWCQLFSEPDAGSDAAAVTTKATRVDGGWLVNGQKVWTSDAHESRWGFATVRTDPDVPKHDGITIMVIDMEAEGVEVRPLRMTTGMAMFNEVFFDDVFVAEDDVVGPVNGGWTVARATLGNESVSIGGGDGALSFAGSDLIAPLDAHPDRLAGGAGRVGRYIAEQRAGAVLNLRSVHRAVSGAGPTPEGAVTKLVLSELGHDAAESLVSLAGPEAAFLDGDGAMSGMMTLLHRAMSIAGGTSEIKRNQIGERLLGLPRDPLIN